MGSTLISLNAFTFLLVIVSSTLPSETRDIDLGIYNSVKQNLPNLSSVKEMYDSVKEKTHDLSSVKDIYKTSYSHGLSAVNNVEAAVRDTANHFLQDEKSRSDLTRFAESFVLAIILELAKGVPGGVPAYNIVTKSFHSDKNLKEDQEESELARFVTEFAKNAGLYVFEKAAQSVPGGVPAYKILSQSLRSLHEGEEMKDHRREIKELRARIDMLEEQGYGCTNSCNKLHDQTQTETSKLGLFEK